MTRQPYRAREPLKPSGQAENLQSSIEKHPGVFGFELFLSDVMSG